MFYYACGISGLGGVIVTASHNPPEYNGFKSVKKMPFLLSAGQGMDEVRDLVFEGNHSPSLRKGNTVKIDINSGYGDKIRELVDLKKIKPLKIVVDAANGMGGVAFDIAYKGLPVEIVRMYFEPDGRMPNHGGDPLIEENRFELQERVVKEKADLGFAFDPDADRFFAIDENGQFLPGDFMTAILGKYFVSKKGSGVVVYDTRASWAIRDLVNSVGGEAIEMRVGHAFIKPKMLETKAVFGGEVSGHFYFPDFYYADSGVLSSLFLLELLETEQKSLAELVEPLRNKYYISGEINARVVDTNLVIDRIIRKYEKDCEIMRIDGISLIGKNWHANIRNSNTEPLLRLNLEALDQALMIQKRDELMGIIQR
jgi:phosphomannomutase